MRPRRERTEVTCTSLSVCRLLALHLLPSQGIPKSISVWIILVWGAVYIHWCVELRAVTLLSGESTNLSLYGKSLWGPEVSSLRGRQKYLNCHLQAGEGREPQLSLLNCLMHMSEVHFSVLLSPGRKDIMPLSILVIIQKASICCNHEGSQFVCAEITAGALPSCCKCVCVLTQTGVFPSLQRTQHYIYIHFLQTLNPVCT